MAGKMFPLQINYYTEQAKPGPRSIPWEIAEEAYSAYAQRYGKGQSLEELAKRGGFSWGEMDEYLPGWRERVDLLNTLRAENEQLKAYGERIREAIWEFREWVKKEGEGSKEGTVSFAKIAEFCRNHKGPCFCGCHVSEVCRL
jgi:hypothetical protein